MAEEKRRIPTNIGAMQAFHVMRQAALMLTSVVLAKSALSVEEIGNWEMLLYIGYTLSFFWASGLVQGMLTMFPKLDNEVRKAFVFNVYMLFATISVAILLVLLVGRNSVVFLLTNRQQLPYIGMFSVFLALNMPVFLLENLYLLHDRARSIFWFGAFSALGQVASVGIPIWIGEGVSGGVAGLATFAGIRHLFLLIFVLKHAKIQFLFSLWSRLIKLSLPLMGYSVLGGLQVALGSWFVAYLYPGDQDKFAIYRYGALELPIAPALINGFGMAVLPEIAKDLKQALKDIRTKSLRLFHILFPIAAIIMLNSKWIFPAVFRDAFAESVPIFNIFLLILVTRMVFSRTILVGLEANRAVLWISFAEILVFAGLCFVLGSCMGLEGIALATLLAYTFEKVLLTVFLWRRFGIGVGEYTQMGWFGFYTVLIAGAFAVSFLL